jgi:hypothetical protein
MRLLGLTVMALILVATGAPLAHAQTSSGIMNIYVMKDKDEISRSMAVPADSGSPGPSARVSFSGFANTTMTDDGATLWVSQGVSRGMAFVAMSFHDANSQGATDIVTVMSRASNSGGEGGDQSNDGGEGSGSAWGALVRANYAPASNPVRLGDAFYLNYSSSLSGQYAGLANGIRQVGQTYAHSDDAKLRTLGGYYLILVREIAKMQGMVPHHIIKSHVKASAAIALDFDLQACLLAIGNLAAASIAFVSACITPAVVAVAPCIAAMIWEAEAGFAAGQACS